jgi:hypothetical protein
MEGSRLHVFLPNRAVRRDIKHVLPVRQPQDPDQQVNDDSVQKVQDQRNYDERAMIGAKRANIASLNTFRPIDLILKAGTGLTADGRKRLSDLIKKRWAERRKKAAAKIK